ncbi:tripartite tricarboxylate transporter TctB family protein [Chelativorans sp. AA-79]|uniref:tripartite tricarboxylate transporter TctB family protein n=1 Tax=Chelativorans sp. AA-79 TaxID=3028735 RepID=UPI0023F96F9F|nr:tripartite tricarboxylate transporter TctB family protein [Chelativorans sp. AA-79]WEX12101.1 tripartite tricarboxylate transporter TctB family protein [Chelativorans sp. AA-79]
MSRFREHAFDWIAWLLFASIPVVIFWQSATSLAEQGAATGGPLDNAAFYPRVIAVLMSAAVLLHGLRLLLGRVQHRTALEAAPGTRLALSLSVLFVAYLILMPYVGFHLATPILLVIMMRALGVRILQSILGSAVLWLVTSYTFEGLLNVVLPVGMLNISIFS